MFESFATAGRARIWTVSEGEGIPVALVSGGPGCCDYLEPVAALIRESARAIRFDARGTGGSDPAREYSMAAWLDDLDAVRTHHGIDRWIVAGHSAGAELALLHAIERPAHTLGIVCVSGGRLVDDREWHRLYAERRDQGMEPPLDYRYPPNMEVNAAVNRSHKDWIKRPRLFREVAEIAAPSVFIYGSEDIRPSWPAEQAASLIPGAEFRLIAGAAHNLWRTHPDALRHHLLSFLANF